MFGFTEMYIGTDAVKIAKIEEQDLVMLGTGSYAD